MTCGMRVSRQLEALATVTEIAPDFSRLCERAQGFVERIERLVAALRARGRALGRRGRAVAPGRVAAGHRPGSTGQAASVRRGIGPGAHWVFTSATLGDDDRLTWFTEPCGLRDAELLRVDSPFDYSPQAALYVPRSFPSRDEPASQRCGGGAGEPSRAHARWQDAWC